jgi:hypothetical protein
MVIWWVFVRNPISTEYILSHKKKKVHTIFYVLHKIFYFGEKMQKIIEKVKENKPRRGGALPLPKKQNRQIAGGALPLPYEASIFVCVTEYWFT